MFHLVSILFYIGISFNQSVHPQGYTTMPLTSYQSLPDWSGNFNPMSGFVGLLIGHHMLHLLGIQAQWLQNCCEVYV